MTTLTPDDLARVSWFVDEMQRVAAESGVDPRTMVLGLIGAAGQLMRDDLRAHPERLTCYVEALGAVMDYVMPAGGESEVRH